MPYFALSHARFPHTLRLFRTRSKRTYSPSIVTHRAVFPRERDWTCGFLRRN